MAVPDNRAMTSSLLTYVERASNFVRRYVHFNYWLFAIVLTLAGISFWFSYEFRFDFQVPFNFSRQRLFLLPYVAFLKVFVFYLLRGHSTNWRYVGLSDIPTLLLQGLICGAVLFLLPLVTEYLRIPRGVILIDFFISLVLIGGARISMRLLRERTRLYVRWGESDSKRKVVVVGAGDAGEMILREIIRNPGSGLQAEAIFDDNRNKQQLTIHGIKVKGGVEDIPAYVQANPVHLVIVAIPSANNVQMKRIHSTLRNLNVTVKTLPPLVEIMGESSALTQLRDITVSDLLGREEVRIDTEQVQNLIVDKVVVVTGAGGSIGSELCRQILKRRPKSLILMERAENSLFFIHRQLTEFARDGVVIPLLCDVRDHTRIHYEFDKIRPDLVFHAAAYKHVPMQELNAVECFKNNVEGVQTLARASDQFGVSRFLLISTDKAVNPVSVMGATKRVCEIYCQAFGRVSRTRFLSVRFGNVLASEGSAVPIFMDQIARGGPVTITHPEMQRYFMTIPEAVTLVLQATALGESGQIMILNMGDPIKIVDLVHQLFQLVGKQEGEIPIEFIGLRPGEKLFEELCQDSEICIETSHAKIKIFNLSDDPGFKIIAKIDHAIDIVRAHNDEIEVRRILKEIVPEYRPASPEQTSAFGQAAAPGNTTKLPVFGNRVTRVVK
ncbi:MAG: polysaccharide biosynthesis protein [Desulfomonilaceae bacterium]